MTRDEWYVSHSGVLDWLDDLVLVGESNPGGNLRSWRSRWITGNPVNVTLKTEPAFAVMYSTETPLAELMGRPLPIAGGTVIQGGVPLHDIIFTYDGVSSDGYPLLGFGGGAPSMILDGGEDNFLWKCIIDADGVPGISSWVLRYTGFNPESGFKLYWWFNDILIVENCPEPGNYYD